MLAFGAVGYRLPRRAAFVGAFFCSVAPLWVLVFLPPLLVAMAALATNGLAWAPLGTVVVAATQERTPVHLRGRVFGALFGGASLAAPLGLLLGGYALEWWGLRPTLALKATGHPAVGISLVRLLTLRSLDREREGY